MFPVESRFAGKGAPLLPGAARGHAVRWESPERNVAQIVQRALREETGDVLVFLPGAGEIRRVQSLLETREQLARRQRVMPLFGDLSAATIRTRRSRRPDGTRKVVLATNIAETSLTIEGVRVVVDSGLVRRSAVRSVNRHEPAGDAADLARLGGSAAGAGRAARAWRVLSRLERRRASQPRAVHAAGDFDADLAPLALDLANWGARDAASLRWLDPPPAAMLASARDLLARLGRARC